MDSMSKKAVRSAFLEGTQNFLSFLEQKPKNIVAFFNFKTNMFFGFFHKCKAFMEPLWGQTKAFWLT
jgi:hypothetical protein